ncbi:MAG: gene transfer agent family protein [Rhizobiaceae bacterium]|nr:gene transfer agent family protein [Rhizobiaceae bacterium]
MKHKNKYRGEISATLDGRDWQLCLTLGALAELEARLGEEDITALARRFSSGRLSAKDMQIIIAVGLRGGGHDIADDEVAQMRSNDGLTGYARIVADLLTATFTDDTNANELNEVGEDPSLNPITP